MELKILQPQIFPKDKIIAGVTMRNNHIHPIGLSLGISKHIDQHTFYRHKKILANYLNVSTSDFYFVHQTHSDIIHFVDGDYKTMYGDALVTNRKNKILIVKIADCAGVLIYDPKKEVISAVHSGWRGSAKNIVPKTIQYLIDNFGTKPEDLLIYISPLASAEKYTVGIEVAKIFPNSTIKANGNYFFDNRKELLLQLKSVGVQQSNIEISPLCTISSTELHSFRRDGDFSGRMAAFIGLK
ncbi:MAG: peptidoglycan editing factor PgeF [Ignavibacteria bacterium]|nr:peptidoglycan editing factor PgeF [Ignavibacteria bacterium]